MSKLQVMTVATQKLNPVLLQQQTKIVSNRALSTGETTQDSCVLTAVGLPFAVMFSWLLDFGCNKCMWAIKTH